MSRYQLIRAPHVADRLRMLGFKEINATVPSAYCAVFELDRKQLKLFHALCKGKYWTPVTHKSEMSTRAHGLVTYSYTWSPTAISGGISTLSGWKTWSVLTEQGLKLEVPHSMSMSARHCLTINSIRDVKTAIIRFHSKSRVETSEGIPTGEFHERLGDKNYGYGVVALPTREHPHAMFIRNYC